MSEVHSLAVFVDFENLALGFKNRKGRFDMQLVLQRLVEKGKIIVKKGYADWSRYSDYKRNLHEAGLELIEIPRRAMTGKNSADIHLVVDAMDLCYSKEHINTFVIVSGDSDFSPLVGKLKENGKSVIGLAMRNSTSDLLVNACDEFIYYEDLEVSESPVALELDGKIPKPKQAIFTLLLETLAALQREVTGSIYASMVKDTIRRKRPSFSESMFGYSSFSALLEDAEQSGVLELLKDARSGTYVVTKFKTLDKSTKRPSRRRPPRSTPAESKEAKPKKESTSSTPTRKKSPRRVSTESPTGRSPRKTVRKVSKAFGNTKESDSQVMDSRHPQRRGPRPDRFNR